MANNDIVPDFDDGKDESIKIKIQRVEDVECCLFVTLTGYLDTYNSNSFQKSIQRAIEAGFTQLIFNCKELNYVSSTGIGCFTSFLKTVKPRGGDIVLLDIQQKVFEVFQLLGFSQFFNMKGNLDEAIEFFEQELNSKNKSDNFEKFFSCPVCAKKLKAVKPGRFRCSACKTIISVDTEGQVSLG